MFLPTALILEKVNFPLPILFGPSSAYSNLEFIISNCLTAKMGTGGSNVPVIVEQNRKLTERECLRIMGFPEDYKIGKGYQAYKQIGNSVVVPVISKLANELVSVAGLNKKEENHN